MTWTQVTGGENMRSKGQRWRLLNMKM